MYEVTFNGETVDNLLGAESGSHGLGWGVHPTLEAAAAYAVETYVEAREFGGGDAAVKEVGGVKVVETHPGGIRPVGRVVADHAYPQGCVFRTWRDERVAT